MSVANMFKIDAEFIERLKDGGYDLWTISLWENWLRLLPEMTVAVQQIQEAFDGVELGGGVGIYEANGVDDYADNFELARLRKLDERHNWWNLDAKLLNQNYSTPSFFDARGFVFHLPAFLLAELDGQYEFGFIDRIVEKRPPSGSWIDLLTSQQASALGTVLSLVKQHPDYYHDAKKLDHAIERFDKIVSAAGG